MKKKILITYNKKIALKVFSKIKKYHFVYCKFEEINKLKNKDQFIALVVSIENKKIDEKFTNKFKNLKYIFSPTTGLTHINLKDSKKNIKIFNLNTLSKTKKITASSEFSILMILALIRNFNVIDKVIKSGNWRNKEEILRGNELNKFKFGIFGFGRIGKNIAKFLRIFNSNLLFYDPYVKKNFFAKKIINLKKFLKNINFLIISAKLTNETNKIFNYKTLRQIKKGSYILNISRGELLVEKDLIKLIKNNHIDKVALDVLCNEDKILKKSNNLIKLARIRNNILITPHIAGLTYESEFKALNEIKKLMLKNLK
tara:strand:- start:41 stop:982 length:942 start_codon:yes stop_codon:yes gene_type:complete